LEHRRFLDHAPGFRPFRNTDLFARIGGQPTVDKLVDALYDRFESDEILRPLFVRDLAHERANQKLFLAEWLGGERRYSERSYSGLKHRHDDLPITRAIAGCWLGHFRRALDFAVAAEADRTAIFEQAQSLAFALAGEEGSLARKLDGKVSRHRSQTVAWCGVGGRPLKRATDLAHRGDVGELRALLKQAPDLVERATFGAKLMQAAALAGRLGVVDLLLKQGVDPNKPHYLGANQVDAAWLWFERILFVTPLCAARMKRRAEVEALFLKHGAKSDIFTAAFLGDRAELDRVLAVDESSSQATDPAVDILDITPILHAVARGHVDALQLLLDHLTEPLKGGVRALGGAAARSDLAMVELLLERGADATQIGVGRWVLNPQLAPLLAARGATVDSSGAWIGHCCTGNQGRKDDPDYVQALLRHGARADDKRLDGKLDATALHYAVKAGFLQTIQILLEHGADPSARDNKGRTPLDWLGEAAQSVDKDSVRRLLA
jgi:hemoglobin